MTLAPRQRTFLAVLLTRPGRPATADELAELVWDGRPPDRAPATLRTYAMRLRRDLGEAAGARIVTRNSGYLIEAAEDEIDAQRFARACHQGAAAYRTGEWAAARAALADGLALWRGDALADIPSQLLRDAEGPALRRQRLQALQWRIDADLQLGGGEELVAELEALTAQEPLREQLHAMLMTALARAGRASEALTVYRQARDLLISQLGVEPGPELRELQRLILAGDRIGRRPAAHILTSTRRLVPHQLPAAARHFTGRAGELKELGAILDHAGNVSISSISGMAGIGKTTLALHWAHQVADRFPDGQLYVDLHGFGPAAPMAPAEALRGFLDALRDPARPLPADADAQGALYRSLTAGRRILIVLDNARDEQQVRPLLPGAASCLTLITSRNQLAGLAATSGAIPLSLDLLSKSEARELLSRRLGPERLAAEQAATDQFVASCTGLPLALCIAAARAALAPGLALTMLSAQLSAPSLDALSGLDPYADLRTVFSWSYRLLSPEAARLFRCLPLFPGPDVSTAAAASITPAGRIDELLTELTSAHLLEEYVPGRFRLHELLARYAQECSEREDGEEQRRGVRDQALSWYTASAAAATGIVTPNRRSLPETGQPVPDPVAGATSAEAISWLEAERPNLVAAVGLAARLGFDETAVKLPLLLWTVFELRAHWQEWLDTCLIAIEIACRTGDVHSEASLRDSISRPYIELGRTHEGIDGLLRALAIRQAEGDVVAQAALYGRIGHAYFTMGDVPAAISAAEYSAALSRESGDRRGEASVTHNIGWIHQQAGQPEAALKCYLTAQAIAADISWPMLAGVAQASLASLYLELNRPADALVAATTAIELNAQTGNLVEQANAHKALGDALLGMGRHTEALPHWRAALDAYRDLGDPRADEVAGRLSSS